MVELDLNTATIVTRNEDERIDSDGGSIEVVPAWRFLLDLPESAEKPSKQVFAELKKPDEIPEGD